MRPQIKTLINLSDDIDGVCATQNPGAAADLSINGALASDGVAELPSAQKLTITSSADDSGITFTFHGTDADGKTILEQLAGGATTTATTTLYYSSITQIETNGNAGSLTVGCDATDGAVSPSVISDWRESDFQQRVQVEVSGEQHVLITTAGDDTDVVFYVTGTDRNGNVVTENMVGASSGVTISTKTFASVTSIATTGDATSGLIVGVYGDTNAIAESQNPGEDAAVTLNGALVSGGIAVLTSALTWYVDETLNDVNVDPIPVWSETQGPKTASELFTVDATNRAVRLRVSGYTRGSAVMTVAQGGI